MQHHDSFMSFLRLAALGAASSSFAAAQTYEFSVDRRGPTISAADSTTATPITEGDVLIAETLTPAFGPLAAPRMYLPHTSLGLLPGCIGHPAGTPCHVEVDALSHGFDDRVRPMHVRRGTLRFSVDEHATGLVGVPAPPSVGTESGSGDSAADTFVNLHDFAPVLVGPKGNTGMVDGNGAVSGSGFLYPGVGLVEPAFAGTPLPLGGDNLDALDLDAAVRHFAATYLSLDSAFVDPLTSIPWSGSAAAHGYKGGDVLVSSSGLLSMYAPAFVLGLDAVGGPDSDDLDALILCENGTPGFQTSFTPFDWMTGGFDMLVFSVRRGSAVVGMPDSRFGIPIAEGDLLIAPIAGGLSPFPAVLIPAESLGLATFRSMSGHNDELDAADMEMEPIFDCNGNGYEDAVDIALGVAVDANGNGLVDACESGSVGVASCFCTSGAPCGNTYATGGCANASGVGAILSASGSASIALDNLLLTTIQMSPGTFALTFRGDATAAPVALGDGQRCVSGSIYRLPPYPTGSGSASLGTGLAALTRSIDPPGGWIFAGSTWTFQTWYRTLGGCGTGSNLSNALSVTFTP